MRYVAKDFRCPHCDGFVATSVDDLRNHILSSHEKESQILLTDEQLVNLVNSSNFETNLNVLLSTRRLL